jgi:cyclophilin family peptidyl-prolyl cis-trans isomerase
MTRPAPYHLRAVGIFACVLTLFAVDPSAAAEPNPRVRMVTNLGEMTIELEPQKAPETVENFLQYVSDGYYEGTIFHRVIKDFMIQGGGFTLGFEKKDTRDPIQNEADNELKNDRFTIAMARTQSPHSATAQFFINTANNDFLNYRSKDIAGWGYAVFGRVVEGQDVADWIGKTPTGPAGPFARDVPANPIVIESVTLINNSNTNQTDDENTEQPSEQQPEQKTE